MNKNSNYVRADYRDAAAYNLLPNGVRVTTVDELREAIADGNTGYVIVLSGGGLFSRKTITRRGNKYHVVNHIDEAEQTLTEQQLFDECVSNIGSAMKAGAMFTLGNQG